MSLLFDIGANVGDASFVGLSQGFTEVVALEPAPRVYSELVKRTIYTSIIPLKYAVSDVMHETVEFYEADEDGLSTLNKDWLTSDTMPYNGKPHRTIRATTITVDRLAEIYGEPDLMKIDVEGGEWLVFRGMTKYHGKLTFEWTDVTLTEHQEQLQYLQSLGYTEVAPQFVTHHLVEPTEWFPLEGFDFTEWVSAHRNWWTRRGWQEAGRLRPTADVGMCWVR
jgi:FkbM family methyltransferase